MPPTYCPCNKPILKRRPTPDTPAPPSDDLLHIDPSVLGQPTVRFPPHATLVTRTFLAHTPDEYDRSPIVVAPNACRLPERGCPGRTYRADSPSPLSSSRRSPRSPATRRPHVHSVLPPLVPDLTSSSDESDSSLPPPVSIPHADFYNYANTTVNNGNIKTSSLVGYTSTDVDSIRYTNTITNTSIPTPTPIPNTTNVNSNNSNNLNTKSISSSPTTIHTPSPSSPSSSPLSLTSLSPSSLSLPSHASHTTSTLSDSPPPIPSPLSNPTSPVSFNVNMRALVSARRERCSRWERGGGGGGRRSVEGSRERNSSTMGKGIGSLSTVVQKVGSSSSSTQKVRRRSEREKERAEREREEKGFKRFGEFGEFNETSEAGERGERGVVTSGWCALRVGDGGCFGGF